MSDAFDDELPHAPEDDAPAAPQTAADDAVAEMPFCFSKPPSLLVPPPPHQEKPLVGTAEFCVGVVLPMICFLIGYPGQPSGQSGQVDAYAKLLLSHLPSSMLYPFLAYCMLSMTKLILDPARYHGNAWVRFGIFSGVVIAAEFWIVFQLASTSGHPMAMLTALFFSSITVVIPWLALGAIKYLFRVSEVSAFVAVIVVCLVGVFFFPVAIAISLWSSTAWAFAAYAVVSYRLLRQDNIPFRFSLAQLMAACTWFAAHCSAWRLSYLLMLEEYSLLPKTSPSHYCFICTAAARGHRRLVGSEIRRNATGGEQPVNDQLRRLKAFELLLALLSPRAHRVCRRIYNRVGPAVAARIGNPWMADVAYVLLKPAEWIARLSLAVVLLRRTGAIDRLYR